MRRWNFAACPRVPDLTPGVFVDTRAGHEMPRSRGSLARLRSRDRSFNRRHGPTVASGGPCEQEVAEGEIRHKRKKGKRKRKKREPNGRSKKYGCPRCRTKPTRIVIHTFKDGSEHLRVECANCGKYIQYLPGGHGPICDIDLEFRLIVS